MPAGKWAVKTHAGGLPKMSRLKAAGGAQVNEPSGDEGTPVDYREIPFYQLPDFSDLRQWFERALIGFGRETEKVGRKRLCVNH